MSEPNCNDLLFKTMNHLNERYNDLYKKVASLLNESAVSN